MIPPSRQDVDREIYEGMRHIVKKHLLLIRTSPSWKQRAENLLRERMVQVSREQTRPERPGFRLVGPEEESMILKRVKKQFEENDLEHSPTR